MRKWRSQLRAALAGWPAWRLALAFLCSVCMWGVLACIALAWLAIFEVVDLRLGGLALAALALFLLAGILGAASRWDGEEDGVTRWFEPKP